jgi:endo-1,4-beta-xylanase
LSIAASIFLFPLSLHAQNEPIIFEAESAASISSLYETNVQNGTTYVTIINDSPNFGPPATQEGALTYAVTFPAAGNYELYVRLLIGPGGGSDDSFFIGNGFGDKVATAGPWTLVNNFAGGYTDPNETVRNAGSAGNQVFKWFKVTGFAGPNPWVVPAGNLTQTFQFAGRETGLLVDKFAFGYQGFFYTVGNLDTGSAPTGTPPPPPPPPYEHPGPPMATGQDKFVGSAWSPGEASLQFDRYFNKVTPENAGKWASVEATRDVMNWTDADTAYNLAKSNGWPFHWHVLVWGNQQPLWIESLPPEEQLEEIKEWFAAIAARYPDIDFVEVVNEPLHDPPFGPSNGNYGNALGGPGETGWDWIINAFELARQYFPKAQLMLNDFSITNDSSATTRYLEIIGLLQERKLIDIIGDQAHGFSTTEPAPMPTHRANLDRLAATGLPIHITELDIPGNDDPVQLANYQRIFPVFWEHPAVEGITLWGYHQNTHWRRASGDWLMYANGAQRPALTWLVEYVENTQPVIPKRQEFRINEHAAVGSVVGRVAANDPDSEQPLSDWQIEGGDGVSVIGIDSNTGVLRVVDSAALDFERDPTLTLQVSVTDGYRRSEPQVVTIKLKNIKE